MDNARELLNLSAKRGGDFVHPVWGGKCRDWLKIMPDKALAKMTPPEVLKWTASHGTHWDNHTNYVAHRIKATHYPIDLNKFFIYRDANDEWGDDTGISDEIENARSHFDVDLNITVFGRSGGWAGLSQGERNSWPKPYPVIKDTHDLADFGQEFDHKLSAMMNYALALLWFDVTVNGIIDTAVGFFKDLTITETTRNVKVTRKVLIFGSKSDSSVSNVFEVI